MSTYDVKTQARTETLLEALPYLQLFKGSIFVVKFGGSIMDNPATRSNIATDLAFLTTVGIQVVVVHGGGKAISRAMQEAHLVPEFRHGLRVTSAEAIEIVEPTLNGLTNREVVEAISEKKARPLGVKGQDVLQCEKLTRDAAGNELDLGFVGTVVDVDRETIQTHLRRDYLPVISPLGRDAQAQVYNINADLAAAHVAGALRARRLVYLCDVPGLLSDPEDRDSIISTLRVTDVEPLKKRGVIGSGMMPKVDSACVALAQGVRRVHFIDGQHPHSLLLEIFTDKGVGTEIVNR